MLSSLISLSDILKIITIEQPQKLSSALDFNCSYVQFLSKNTQKIDTDHIQHVEIE